MRTFIRPSPIAPSLRLKAFGFTQAVAVPSVTLDLADAAPSLKLNSWLKGHPATNLAAGKIHVLESWATWCSSCKGAVPHLSAPAEKNKGAAVFTGVSVWESAHGAYASDVAEAAGCDHGTGDMMVCNVAMDDANGDRAKSWTTAAGQRGIPASFIVDGKGAILWIGHPRTGLDEVVRQAIEGKLAAESGKKIPDGATAKYNEMASSRATYAERMRAKDYDGAVIVAVHMVAVHPGATEPIQWKVGALAHTARPAARSLAVAAAKANLQDPYLLLGLAHTLTDAGAPGSGAPASMIAQAKSRLEELKGLK